jgi:hypothetical protein
MQRIRRSVAVVVLAAAMSVAFSGAAAAQQGFSVGVGFLGDNSRTMFNLFGSQGATRGIGSVTSTLTTLDGYGGYFAAGSIQPFVTGVVPVVGGQPQFGQSAAFGPAAAASGQSVLAERIARLEAQGEVIGAPSANRRTPAVVRAAERDEQNVAAGLAGDRSTAAEAVDSIAAIRRQRAAAKTEAFRVAAEHFAQGVAAENDGKAALAAHFYRIAHRDGDEAVRQQAAIRLNRLDALRGK